MSDIKNIDDYRPHICLPHSKGVSVIPMVALEDMAEGKIDPKNLESTELSAIINEWLQTMGECSDYLKDRETPLQCIQSDAGIVER